MSYDLYFWRYRDEEAFPPGKAAIFVEHMNALGEGEPPDEVAPLPKEDVETNLSANLKAAGWTPDGIFWQRGDAVIEVYLGSHHASFSMKRRWSGDDANFLIDIMRECGCPLFDPQTSERFAL